MHGSRVALAINKRDLKGRGVIVRMLNDSRTTTPGQ